MEQQGHAKPKLQKHKRIIVCCDGTACSALKQSQINPHTNVSRISRCVKATGTCGIQQIVHYVPGIGTADDNPTNAYNQGVGKGIDERIINAYSFICHNYGSIDDEIILIGFSRGAYIVRCVADFVTTVGLLTKRGLHYLYPIYKTWSEGGLKDTGSSSSSGNSTSTTDHHPKKTSNIEINGKDKNLCEKVMEDTSLRRPEDIRIKVCAVWDTVSSLGIPKFGIMAPAPTRKLNFIHSDLCDGIDNAFQALALHEHRKPFLPVVWRLPQNRQCETDKLRLHQCWFMGYHGDVGGGNELESLAHISLVWMMAKLEGFIDFDENNFWNPHPERSSWQLTESSGGAVAPIRDTIDQSQDPRLTQQFLTSNKDNLKGHFRVRVHVPDSKTWLYWITGSGFREPCRQFWTADTYEKVDEPGDGNDSQEHIHFSVRLMTKWKAFQSCEALQGARCELENETQKWNIPIPPKQTLWQRFRGVQLPDPVTYKVAEDESSKMEVRLLRQWLDTELRLLQQGSTENQPNPITPFPTIMEWLDKEMEIRQHHHS